jgi:hypothetical protein
MISTSPMYPVTSEWAIAVMSLNNMNR